MKGIPWDKELYKNTARWVPTPESAQLFRVQVLHRTGQGENKQTPAPPPAHPPLVFFFFLISRLNKNAETLGQTNPSISYSTLWYYFWLWQMPQSTLLKSPHITSKTQGKTSTHLKLHSRAQGALTAPAAALVVAMWIPLTGAFNHTFGGFTNSSGAQAQQGPSAGRPDSRLLKQTLHHRSRGRDTWASGSHCTQFLPKVDTAVLCQHPFTPGILSQDCGGHPQNTGIRHNWSLVIWEV